MFSLPRSSGRSLLAGFVVLGGLAIAPQARSVVTFDFQYADAAGVGFNDPNHPEYKTALAGAGQTMGSYFAHTATITIRVTSINNPNSATLATAGSGLVSPNGRAGFFRTVVQGKVISNGATDLNGADPDGELNVNLGGRFQFNPDGALGANQVDFRATIIHELTHASASSPTSTSHPTLRRRCTRSLTRSCRMRTATR